jgi:vacuolar protein sorting-associated protein 13D
MQCLSCLQTKRLRPPGFIGKITLQIPFYRLHSEPWVISISQLNLVIGPARPQEFDEEREREEEKERKKLLLKALEDKWRVRRRPEIQSAFDSLEIVVGLWTTAIVSV